MLRAICLGGTAVALLLAAVPAAPASTPVTPAGWRVTPVAARIESADLFDLTQGLRTSYVPYDGTQGKSIFYGAVFSPDGTQAWASGGGQRRHAERRGRLNPSTRRWRWRLRSRAEPPPGPL
jgi:hypothetical protein